jgi:shikimate kinase
MIVLIGPKHSGKSSVGVELARLLNIPFYDVDALIEERTGLSPRSLYNTGVEHFQREEAAALAVLAENAADNGNGGADGANSSHNAVVAAGGGITDNSAAVSLLKNGHLIVYLDVSAQTAWRRIASAGELPPFLTAETPQASMEKHRLLHERRANDCRAIANVVINAAQETQAKIAEKLLKEIAR